MGITLLLMIVAGVPVYFACRWAARKLFSDQQAQRIATWAATVLVTPLAGIAGVAALLFVGTWYPDRNFSAERWRSRPGKRYELSKDLIESRRLHGMTAMEVTWLLGEPDEIGDCGTWNYEMGCIFMDGEVLEVEFLGGRVASVRSPGQNLPKPED